jgi:predicted transposase YdaD
MAQVQMLLSRTDIQSRTNPKITEIIKLIETIIVYKFPQLSREEIEGMYGLSELRKTKVYQEVLQEGKQEGLDHERSLILRMIESRVGKVSQKARSASATKVVRRFCHYLLLSLIRWVRHY